MIVHRIFNYISRKSSVIILTPAISVVGNCAEQIYFGLLKARREGKKLLILFPYDLPWKFHFPLTNREIFDVDSDFRYRPPLLVVALWRCLLTLLYGPLRVTSQVLDKFFSRHFHGYYTHPAIGSTTLWQPEEEPEDFSWETVRAYEWEKQLREYMPVKLREAKRSRAEAVRREMGLPLQDWFVCLHVREGGFYNDHAASACRNASVQNYVPGIKAITDRGGWVVRMGDKTMTPLPRMDRVMDYPHGGFKSDLMDIYLLSECRFYVGMTSGILDVAYLFQKPVVLTNMVLWTFAYPRRRGDLGIIKHIYSRSRGRFLSLQEVLEEPWGAQHFRTLGDDYVPHENAPEEIRDLIVEFLDNPRNRPYSELQEEANRRRILQGRKILSQTLIEDHFDDMHNRYRIASRIESSLGALGQKFLEENWRQSSRSALARP